MYSHACASPAQGLGETMTLKQSTEYGAHDWATLKVGILAGGTPLNYGSCSRGRGLGMYFRRASVSHADTN